MHQSWRSAIEWRNSSLPLYTGSDQACKLYDAALTQYVGWYEDPLLGGLEQTLLGIKSADPNFVMGQVISLGLELIGTGRSTKLDLGFKNEFDQMISLSKMQAKNLSERELFHVEALRLFSEGNLKEAADVWEVILTDNPTDMLAIKYAHDTYFYLGLQPRLRDSIASVLTRWKPTEPLYGYLHGMYAFGLVETNFYRKAESVALKGLELNPKDAWSTHGLAHVYEMEGRADEGIEFMKNTVLDWEYCGLLACHNYWHLALYHIEKREYEATINIFDDQLSKRVLSGALLDMVDAASILFRLEIEGLNVEEKWKQLLQLCLPHLEDNILLFNDMHLFMVCLGAKDKMAQEKKIQSMLNFIMTGNGSNNAVCKQIGMAVLNALSASKEEDYSKVVNLLNPIRYDLVRMGGSDAQRDILNMLLIYSAMKSSDLKHKKLAKCLLLERQAMKGQCTLKHRLQSQLGSLLDI